MEKKTTCVNGIVAAAAGAGENGDQATITKDEIDPGTGEEETKMSGRKKKKARWI